MTNPYKRGDSVIYRSQGGSGSPIEAKVVHAHQNDECTVEASFALDDNGQPIPGYLGYRSRLPCSRLVAKQQHGKASQALPASGLTVSQSHGLPALGSAKRKTAIEIILEVNQIAHIMLRYIGSGYEAPPEHRFFAAQDSRSKKAWAGAVEIYEQMTCTEVHDALFEFEDEFMQDASLRRP